MRNVTFAVGFARDVARVIRPKLTYLQDGALLGLHGVAASVSGLLVYAAMARVLGAETVGVYGYAVAVIQLFAPLVMAGIEAPLTRDLVERRDAESALLGSAQFLVFVLLLPALAIPLLYLFATGGRSSEIFPTAVGLALQFLPTGWLVLFHCYRARRQVRLAVLCSLCGVGLATVIKLLLIFAKLPIHWVAAASVVESGTAALLLVAAYRRAGGKVSRWKRARATTAALLAASWPVMASGFVIGLFFRITQLMMKDLAPLAELGRFTLAFQVFMLLNYVPQAMLSAIYPRVVALNREDVARFDAAIRLLYVGFAALAYVILLAVTALGEPLGTLLFGAPGASAAPVAAVLAGATIFTFSAAVRGQVIFIRLSPMIHVVNALLGLVAVVPLNAYLIPRHGAVGGAIGLAAACFVSGVGSSFLVPPLRTTGTDQILGFLLLRRHSPSGLSA
jgi:O-antigen/teichoic acid export membrane protein